MPAVKIERAEPHVDEEALAPRQVGLYEVGSMTAPLTPVPSLAPRFIFLVLDLLLKTLPHNCGVFG